jgi:molybdopterin-guanine dinucleotide biosynthesis protein A
MRRLGAIIAGGKATRFGSDKAAASLNGTALIEHVADGLRDQVDKLIVCGRAWPGMDWVEDRPFADMGPLGGLNAALHYAQQNGFDEVVTAGCDVVPSISTVIICLVCGLLRLRHCWTGICVIRIIYLCAAGLPYPARKQSRPLMFFTTSIRPGSWQNMLLNSRIWV